MTLTWNDNDKKHTAITQTRFKLLQCKWLIRANIQVHLHELEYMEKFIHFNSNCVCAHAHALHHATRRIGVLPRWIPEREVQEETETTCHRSQPEMELVNEQENF